MTWAESKGTGLGLRRWVTRKGILWSFISVDIVTTGMQATGAGIVGRSTSKKKDPSIGNNILLAGLAIQCMAFLLFFIFFTIVVVVVGGEDLSEEKSVHFDFDVCELIGVFEDVVPFA